jgi:hypothetical protein
VSLVAKRAAPVCICLKVRRARGGCTPPRQFVNIPNTISPYPQSLMLPREVAIKDGLKIRQ